MFSEKKEVFVLKTWMCIVPVLGKVRNKHILNALPSSPSFHILNFVNTCIAIYSGQGI